MSADANAQQPGAAPKMAPSRPARPTRVLVVDDSLLTRRVLSAALGSAPDLEVVGAAASGPECLAQVQALRPDVVTLDVEMPQMDGLAVLRQLMAQAPVPVVMVSYLTREGTDATVRALLAGAVDFVPKPGGPILGSVTGLRDELVTKVRAAARARLSVLRRAQRSSPDRALPPTRHPVGPPGGRQRVAQQAAEPPPAPPSRALGPEISPHVDRLVILGASTGGPLALQTVLQRLQPDGRTAYVIVQHMPDGMTNVLAELLNSCTSLSVREAHQRDTIAADTALLTPGDWHLRFGPGGSVELDRGPKVHFVRPSVDVALLSAAELFGDRTVAVVLTGMGSDGADGAAAIHRAGGQVVVEDESTSVVWGMPRAVVQRGVAHHVLPLPKVATAIQQLVSTPALAGRAATGTPVTAGTDR